MNTETLISKLSLEAGPVRPLDPPAVRFLKWFLPALGLFALGVYAVGPRPDLQSAVTSPIFMATAMVTSILALICVLSAFMLARPDLRNRKWEMVSMGSAATWLATVAFLLGTEGFEDPRVGIVCIARIIFLSLGPAILLFIMLRSAAPLPAAFVGFLAAVGALAGSEVAVQFLCRQSSLAHIAVWHFLPVCAFALLGALGGRFFFRADRAIRRSDSDQF